MSEYKCYTSWFFAKGTAGTIGRHGGCRRQWGPGSARGARARADRRSGGARRARTACASSAALATPAACHPPHAPHACPATATAAASQSPTREFTCIKKSINFENSMHFIFCSKRLNHARDHIFASHCPGHQLCHLAGLCLYLLVSYDLQTSLLKEGSSVLG